MMYSGNSNFVNLVIYFPEALIQTKERPLQAFVLGLTTSGAPPFLLPPSWHLPALPALCLEFFSV